MVCLYLVLVQEYAHAETHGSANGRTAFDIDDV